MGTGEKRRSNIHDFDGTVLVGAVATHGDLRGSSARRMISVLGREARGEFY